MAASYTGGRVALTTHLSVDLSVSVNRVRLPAGHFTTRLYRARVDYAFSPWMFVSALRQYHSAEQSVGSNLRFRWEYRPGQRVLRRLLRRARHGDRRTPRAEEPRVRAEDPPGTELLEYAGVEGSTGLMTITK